MEKKLNQNLKEWNVNSDKPTYLDAITKIRI